MVSKKSKLRALRRRAPEEIAREHEALALGCVVCGAPAEPHRPAPGQVIPLCALHHRLGGPGVALHADVPRWEARHGSQGQLLAIVAHQLEVRAPGGT